MSTNPPEIEILDAETLLPIDPESSMRIEDLLQRYDQILQEMDALNHTVEGILKEISAIQPAPSPVAPPSEA